MNDSTNKASDSINADLVPVFEAADISLIRIVKSVLESGGVPFVVQGETALEMLPLKDPTVGTGKPPLCAVIYVSPYLKEEAETLLCTLQITDGPLKLPDETI